jgi:hypothetical protein
VNPGDGPYETEAQARALPAVQAVYDAFRADPGVGRMAPHNAQMLADACTAANVATGAYDRRILAWLAGLGEPQVCAVITGLIRRAALPADDRPTILTALEEAADDKRDRAANCSDCNDQSCGTCQYRLQRAQAYDSVAARLHGARQASKPEVPARQPAPSHEPGTQRQSSPEAEAGR